VLVVTFFRRALWYTSIRRIDALYLPPRSLATTNVKSFSQQALDRGQASKCRVAAHSTTIPAAVHAPTCVAAALQLRHSLVMAFANLPLPVARNVGPWYFKAAGFTLVRLSVYIAGLPACLLMWAKPSINNHLSASVRQGHLRVFFPVLEERRSKPRCVCRYDLGPRLPRSPPCPVACGHGIGGLSADSPIRSPTRVSPVRTEPVQRNPAAPGHHPCKEEEEVGTVGVVVGSVARGTRCVSRSRRNPACFAGWGGVGTPHASFRCNNNPRSEPRVPAPRGPPAVPAESPRVPCLVLFRVPPLQQYGSLPLRHGHESELDRPARDAVT
jgi:hypothetical protein